MNRCMSSFLAAAAPYLWLMAIALVILRAIDRDMVECGASVIVVLAAAAAAGTVTSVIRERDDGELEYIGRKLAEATRGRLRPTHLRKVQ